MVFLLSLSITLPGFPGPPETPWDALRHLPKRRAITVLNRDGSCLTGAFVSSAEDSLTLAADDKEEKYVTKADVLRISAGETADVHFAVYSGRSSWADLQALQSPPYYSDLLIITADDRQFNGSLLGVSGEELTLLVNHSEMHFTKNFVARVLLTGHKPAFEKAKLTWRMVSPARIISSPQPVPIYESTLREDNAAIECPGDSGSRRHKKKR